MENKVYSFCIIQAEHAAKQRKVALLGAIEQYAGRNAVFMLKPFIDALSVAYGVRGYANALDDISGRKTRQKKAHT